MPLPQATLPHHGEGGQQVTQPEAACLEQEAMTTAARGQQAKALGLKSGHVPVLPHSPQPTKVPPKYC